MTDYLNKNAEFRCICNKKLSIVGIPTVVNGYGSNLLTNANKLLIQPMDTCPQMPPNPPVFCAFSAPRDLWLQGCVESSFKIQGNSVLKQGSSVMVCPLNGSLIRCTSSGVNGKICTGAASLSGNGIEEGSAEVDNSTLRSDTDSSGNYSGDNSVLQSEVGTVSGGGVSGVGDDVVSVQQNMSVQLKKEVVDGKQEETDETVSDTDLYCQYNPKDDKCKQCQYRKQQSYVDNDSSVLEANYRKYFLEHCDEKLDADFHYDELVENDPRDNPDRKWVYAAHHIISGNQIFNKYPKIVKLAFFCGYDINNAKNCVMLLTLSGNRFPGDFTDEQKSAYAYDCMNRGRAQWHVGHHNYGMFSNSDRDLMKQQIELYTGKIPDELKDYAKIVSEDIENLESDLEMNKASLCWATDVQKKSFCDVLNGISTKIKVRIGKFTEKPHRSYPYFVSQEAYRYAFNVPRSSKIMVVDWRDEKVVMHKMIADRFGDTMEQQGASLRFHEPKGCSRSCRVYELNNRQMVQDCIYFTGEYVNFVLLSSRAGDELRKIFPLEHAKDLSEKILVKDFGMDSIGICKVLEINSAEILVWLRNIRCDDDKQSVSGKVKALERLMNWRGDNL